MYERDLSVMLRNIASSLALAFALVTGCSDAPDEIEPTPAGTGGSAGKAGAAAAGKNGGASASNSEAEEEDDAGEKDAGR